MPIQTATIHFNDAGTPVAEAFDDVYFSNANGLAETRYVFLANNDLPDRWRLLQSDETCIAETGFGTGLNFLACWQAFAEFRQANPTHRLKRLYFISFEKFPLQRQDLANALKQWPELSAFSDRLIQHYPSLTGGCHRLIFEESGFEVILDLWLGDLHDLLPQVETPAQGLVDSWFLDGFAPSKNPEMWTDALFSHMARLGKQNCTFATFTAAGFVRRGLQQAGFSVERRKGFGQKREMLAGILTEKALSTSPLPWFHRQISAYTEVTVVGGGLAAANLCYALCSKGVKVTLYSQDIGDGASGNRQGGFYPQLHSQINLSSNLMAQAFGFARRRYLSLLAKGHSFAMHECGVLQVSFNQALQDKAAKLIGQSAWPEDLIYQVDASEACALSGLPLPYPGLFIPHGGWISPKQLVQALLDGCGDNLQINQQHNLQFLTAKADGWQLHWQDGSKDNAQCLVLALGAQSPLLAQLTDIPLRAVRGQVETIPAQDALKGLKTVLCHKGYLTPEHDGDHALGSTYVKQDMSCEYRQDEELKNLQTHQKALSQCDWAQQIQANQQGRASIRLSTPDHLPVMGAVADVNAQQKQYAELHRGKAPSQYPIAEDIPGLFVLTALGSRGLCTAPLLAEALACQLSGSPLPMDRDTLAALSPNRFLIRQLQKRPEHQ
ncbi:bifunctional tRNA (5-methylaminomethyl-2-thiouridine)(34)-methyltransferase MnmD/FAD-dependent 5-carboxymethylaminomethyl-2-thiouridine(34) oxidoreductase MnmC [Aliiglaciecola sp. CAU 1673]|uniref:bifunctional tRNA (5-methylaminomethyl-2-thiouridine)(34)-methyltransferase MnmD/FAD-dependent 5-carboxymethylaminomethyl-2-thiouridine(34) oxidoreductase MnmC n=1 Tax=Aliiglaciecola sp. CAU 1673 TaxID=3032595 RepID=UPI0023D99AE5|nr:bifunctional tRNA (5-methylaminomethyl-2-thiouridine)(34)-methyltransferase MnmD/FAD-dependent 5-carboxymethylaminomethyl-2-thiouridine(34) oxidoreductase MnmC [Aliiglaciecola sp. CAU 1673]MDF2178048.1 bifunctional tRNA (5-methylaminomethyl-2-thiouridine)(34)-methyltransferase MnmD/FAD-dependent 5-carboxymethylaminomethyl-2-thiouridine(34) oxidoreductase MnmC [Aliiglaciecola sp. CAU 1673]